MTPNEPMDATFAVFNGHVNHAHAKADAEFVRLFDQKTFDRHIKPYDDGIMAIFAVKPNIYRMAWIAMVTVLVNERHSPASFRDAIRSYEAGIEALTAKAETLVGKVAP
jgi:hypothetical protein